MTPLDRLIQRWRIAKARRYIPADARVLDVGSHDGVMLERLGTRIHDSVGIDVNATNRTEERFRLVAGHFPDDLPDTGPFDAITMLAVVEHMQPAEQRAAAEACERLLAPGGKLVITTPSPMVDRILDVLEKLRLVHGMELHQHYGFDPRRTPEIFATGVLAPKTAKRFQFGLNYLFVFEKASGSA